MKTRLALVLVGSLLASACNDGPRSSARASTRPNVVFVCIDTLRADHLGAYGYGKRPTSPALDRLADESTVFEDVSSTAGWTKPSVPSFLTGTYPLQHGVYEGSSKTVQGETSHVLSDEAETLAEAFQAAGWRTGAFVKNAQLNRGNGFEQGFDLYRDQVGDARELRWQALDWIDAGESAGDGRPFFLYLHFLDAHWPYPIPDEAALRFASEEGLAAFRQHEWKELRDKINEGERAPTPGELELLLQLYDAGIRYVDDQLGILFQGLDRRGLWDDTLVCVISDHGEEFMEHGRIGHGHGLYEDLLEVPWILRIPGRDRSRVASPVSLVDVFPTLAGIVGLAVPEAVVGHDRLAHDSPVAPIFAEHKEPGAYQQALRVSDRKLVRRFEQLDSARPDFRPAPGARWDVELATDREGGLFARELELVDDPADDPFELKGQIARLERNGFTLCGLDVRFEDDVELYGEVPAEVDLAYLSEGLAVKVKGEWREGVLVAEKIKCYDPTDAPDFELRGKLEELADENGVRRLRFGPVWVEYDASTRWDVSLLEDEGSPMTREAVAELCLDPEARAGYERESSCYDLARDPGELDPASEGCADLDQHLDQLGQGLAGLARHGGTRALDGEALEQLRELGYVR